MSIYTVGRGEVELRVEREVLREVFNELLGFPADVAKKKKRRRSKVSFRLERPGGTGNTAYRPNNLTFSQSVATRVRFRTEKRLLR